jgi:thiol-disulfide isomerase/thioredoxin
MKISSTELVRKIVGDKRPKVVYYYMEGCPYCIKTTPLWNKVKKMGLPYKFYEVEHEIIPSEFGIQGFPQFHIRDKNGVRTVEGSKDSVQELLSALALKRSGGTRKNRRGGNRTSRFVGRIR